MTTITQYGVLVSHEVGSHVIECGDRDEAEAIVRDKARAPGQTFRLVVRRVRVGEWRFMTASKADQGMSQ